MNDKFSTSTDHKQITITCSSCEQVRPVLEFHRNRSKASGHDSRCKRCVARFKKLGKLCADTSINYNLKFNIVTEDDPDAAFLIEKLRPVIEEILSGSG